MRLSVLASLPPLPESIPHGPRSISSVQLLRISITDRCNLRCVYCMHAAGLRWLPQSDLLSFDEIADVVRAAVECHGIRRIKLTGGEPTLRHGLPDLIGRLRAIPGVKELSLTTNGILLEHLAQPLKESGLDRVTLSIDSLDPVRFAAINRLRLSADGRLHSCLFEGGQVDIRRIVRSSLLFGERRSALAAAMEQCVGLKPIVPGGHGCDQMSRIGG